jgi:hypothetical protein
MTNKTNTRRRVVVQVQPPKQKKEKKRPTPFGDAGAIVGSGLGSMFGAPYLKGVGRWLGTGIGSIFGSGDYQVVGNRPEYNVIANGAQIPKFSTSKQTNIVCHREYLGDIQGTAAFTNRVFPLNPGMAETFPWLSTIAQNYQEYKFHGVIFEFRPLITDFVVNGAPGVVVMATNYNADAPAYFTKQAMENSEYAVSVKPTRELIHGVECAMSQTVLPQLYVRSGIPPANQDLRLYDLGNFQFATQTNPVQNLGELWVSYCVEFFKPILPTEVGGNVRGFIYIGGGVTSTLPLGSATISTQGDLKVIVSGGTQIQIHGCHPNNIYRVSVFWQGGATALTFPSSGSTNFDAVNWIATGPSTKSNVYAGPSAGIVDNKMSYDNFSRYNGSTPGIGVVNLSAGGAFPTTSIVTVVVMQVSGEAVQ